MRTLLRHVFTITFSLLAACSFSQTTGYSGTGGNIDVKYHRFVWGLNPASGKNIAGTVTTYFKTTQSNVSTISFDFAKASFNNASLIVKYHGSSAGVTVSFPASGNVNILRITLPVTLAINTLDSVSISYSGTPPTFGTYGEGMDRQTISGLGTAVYTLAESYGDDDFWPCKADMQDKIDSVDFVITTPSAYRAAANGVLISDIDDGTNRTMTYKHRYPITSYLVAVSVAKYSVYNRAPVNINGTNVPIVYYIGSGRTPTAGNLTVMDYCRDQLVAFSNAYGDYPFKNEKYGMYEFGWGGGMEHQTFSAMSWNSMISWSVVAHELAHQWFGDKVTFATWNHLWLAEGFAKYSEALAAELVPAMGKNPVTHRSTIKTTALARSGTPVYLSDADIANSNLIWTTANDEAVYQRGAMVVSMLRKLVGDTKFFLACKNYLNDPALAYQSATTQMLRDHFEAVTGYDLDAFFTDYIWGTGNPAYDISWGSNGSNINIELTTQRRSTGSTVPYFRTPVVLKIYNSGKTQSATVVIYDQNGQVSYAGNGIYPAIAGKVLGYNLPFVPNSVEVDPDYETLVRGQDATTQQSTVTRVTRLNINPITVLPVSIIDFKGATAANGNLLSLLIASTTNKGSITLERSADGIHFYFLGNMTAGVNNQNGTSYNFLDNKISNHQILYYRAKITDEKGEVSYSKTIAILRQDMETDITLSPNPTSNYLRISLPVSWQNKQVQYTIYSTNGMVIKKERIIGSIDIKIVLGNIPSGNYTIEFNNDNSKVSKKFAVVH